ncbi:hypothetical protein HDV63DRAFT_339405 [Trichoderma sp. SZMC 28014]
MDRHRPILEATYVGDLAIEALKSGWLKYRSLDERIFYCASIPGPACLYHVARLSADRARPCRLSYEPRSGVRSFWGTGEFHSSRLCFSPLSLPAQGYHHVILVMGDDPLARFIRTAFPGYRLEPHYLLFALRKTSPSLHILQIQADADLRSRAVQHASSGAATNWAHTSRNHEDTSPVTCSSSDGGACTLKRGDLGVGDDGWKYACSYRDVASQAGMIPLTPLLQGSRRGLAHSYPIRRHLVS